MSQSSFGSTSSLPRPKLGVHAAKSPLLARISTDLTQLGDEDAGKENTGTPFQKATSGGSLTDKESGNLNVTASCSASTQSVAESEPKENITPQGVSATAPVSPAASRAGTSVSGQLRTRRRLRAVSHVKIRRSVCNVESSSVMLDPSTGNTGASATSSGTPSNVDIRLNAPPKRPKVSAKVANKPRRKQMPWAGTDDQQTDGQPKAVLLTKLEKQSLRGEKLRPGTIAKTKKLVPQPSTTGETSKPQTSKLDVSQGFVNFVGKLSTAKDVKAGASAGKQSANISVDKDWIRTKTAARFNKVLKPDSEPSTSEPSCSSVTCGGGKVDVKLKSAVLRSMEKGSKSRLLCPMRRRSNEGKKAWKSLERKSDN